MGTKNFWLHFFLALNYECGWPASPTLPVHSNNGESTHFIAKFIMGFKWNRNSSVFLFQQYFNSILYDARSLNLLRPKHEKIEEKLILKHSFTLSLLKDQYTITKNISAAANYISRHKAKMWCHVCTIHSDVICNVIQVMQWNIVNEISKFVTVMVSLGLFMWIRLNSG